MKKALLFSFASVVAVILLAGCLKNDPGPTCTNNTIEKDKHVIDSFINNSDGMYSYLTWNTEQNFYNGVKVAGTGGAPTSSSKVAFKITTSLLNGTVIDSASARDMRGTLGDYSADRVYGGLINYTLPKIQKGGTYIMIIPSSLYAGCSAVTSNLGKTIPAYSQIIQQVDLIDVAN